ncbi:hypothetical protein C8D03_4296 [Bosea sp. 124]|nr:hypothetical protein C8D03_4296 [Bosea sp. 124]
MPWASATTHAAPASLSLASRRDKVQWLFKDNKAKRRT